MNPDKPQPEIQMTPVEFSPTESVGDVGVTRPAPRPEFQFPVFVPLLIILLTLIFSTVRDIMTLNKRMTDINTENAPSVALLKKAAQQFDFIQAFRNDLVSQASSDPVAAKIVKEFFTTPAQPQPQSQSPTPASPDTSDKTPAQ